ncbi:MAG: M15 family metallopeptidase [Myxococcales bacterium]
MHALFAAALLATATPRTYGPEKLPEVADAKDPLVDAAKVVPHLIVDLRYATSNNFAGRPLYPNDTDCLLRRSVAERLALAARTLAKERLRLVAWDCLRSPEAQMALWQAHPVPGAVAEPGRGSLHERGVAVDVGLAGWNGDPVELPTAFDSFGPTAAADAPLPDGPARRHRDLLISAMRAAGFRPNPKEWWHFSRLYGWRWPVATARTPRVSK